ncbi:MAG: hypothetical protein WAL90_13305 [Desulfobacterales bacterium]
MRHFRCPAFFDGLVKEFFRELMVAFQLFTGSGDWRLIDEAAHAGYRTTRRNAETMLALHGEGRRRQDPQRAAKEIERRRLGEIGRRG